jgi:hypothetical protein
MKFLGKLSVFIPQAYRGILFIARKYRNSFFFLHNHPAFLHKFCTIGKYLWARIINKEI